jgi:uncharacterized repeat protein (TIGR03803 family)
MKRAGRIVGCAGSLLTILLALGGFATAQQEKVILNFEHTVEGGQNPTQGLVIDSNGNLYGTTSGNGENGVGIVFELMPQKNGKWVEKRLYQLHNNRFATNSCLIFDSAGNLYTNVEVAGAYRAGEVLKLTPATTGEWTAIVLHTFNRTDGLNPIGCLTFDSAGNLYGATAGGGAHGGGTVFELTPMTGGYWTETILHNFKRIESDGGYPNGSLVFDSAGNLYGTTRGGTLTDYGCVFKLSPSDSGSGWSETVLHTFTNKGTSGYYPYAGLIVDSWGILYGTTFSGGADGQGTVFALSPGYGFWTLHSFNGLDGSGPWAALAMDSKGNLYGTTASGGFYGWGSVFELTTTRDGLTYWLLHSFDWSSYDGATPVASVVLDASGNLYGTTEYGGDSMGDYDGTVFEISPY